MLKHRVISGLVILTAVFTAAYFLPVLGVWLLLLAISGLAQLEFYAMIEPAGFPVFRIVGVVCGSLLISATFLTSVGSSLSVLESYYWENFVLLASLVAVFIRQFPQKHNKRPLETISCTLLGIWYVPFLFNFITRLAFGWGETSTLMRVGATGRSLCIFLIVVVKCADIGAYLVGRVFGRHKLFPRISPKKTWEGLAGGIGAALLVSGVFYVVGGGTLGTIQLRMRDVLFLGAVLPVVGLVGDMFESLLKRAAGTKDSSAVIPGMGGILDVLDSLLFTAPVLYLYAQVFWR